MNKKLLQNYLKKFFEFLICCFLLVVAGPVLFIFAVNRKLATVNCFRFGLFGFVWSLLFEICDLTPFGRKGVFILQRCRG